MVLQNYQNLIEMTSNIFYIVAFGVGIKCPRKIHLNTQCPPPIEIGLMYLKIVLPVLPLITPLSHVCQVVYHILSRAVIRVIGQSSGSRLEIEKVQEWHFKCLSNF